MLTSKRSQRAWLTAESGDSLTAPGDQTPAGSGFVMCGRFTQKMTWREVHTLYRMPEH